MVTRTSASVTEEPCGCDFLDREADDPDTPIVFDEQLKEYRFECPSSKHGSILIYHCPFCGGAATESKRGKLFAVVSSSEADRLYQSLEHIQSLEEAIRIIGSPDQDDPRGLVIHRPEKDGKAPTVESYRSLLYKKLSETADIRIMEHPKTGTHITLEGKYIGPPAGNNGV